ncbi:threonine--tRNA ligase, cytoplasmic isoform X1 [Eurytemora carolleeae]|uniref:threonine--tRNA ligase, cytoplasmic isoform X1 n=1 Tax=Eurytemora carolleeae TaxID=1294199 RepID=UPI000C7908D4|nr:threonine--tRNA ligase, cytoplasmic isoform X1 [Eurytemora carolleeae]|eukprot:XP_023320100.1 threonine--tRNA ligase, cytoplasmic-like isoform X1 [Eurytemora affinis]
MKFSNLSKPEGLENLDNYLLLNSFICGVEPTQADLKVFSSLKPGLIRPYSNISRWFNNISSFSDAVKHFPASDIIVEVEVEDQSEKKELKAMKKEKVKKEKAAAAGPGKVSLLNPPPDFIAEREKMWDRLKAEREVWLAEQTPAPISVTLPDGKQVAGESWRTTPYDVALGISKGLADNTVVARVDGELWDLDRPLEKDVKLELVKFDDEEGQAVFWHSSAHVLGEAMERVYGGHLCYGPPIDQGFYYDMWSEEHKVSDTDFKVLDDVVKTIVKEKQPFERLEMKKSDLLEMFKYNEFKVRILNEKVKTDTTTVYRCGPLIDLCRGPHVRNTGKIKAMAITKNSATYWEGNSEAESLQRIYGISFPENKQLKEWKTLQEEAAKRDHRKLGIQQDLFFFHELSPGSCFFQPKGAHIYNKLLEFIKEEYWKRGFQEVISPNMYNSKLWKTSGHWDHYAENMFRFDVEKEAFGLKPMNCPGHCLIFDHRPRPYKELPLRMADFGVLHRNELSGALTGLTRVRRFQQDDAHIFCRPDQIKEEMAGCLDFLKHVYSIFGFTYQLRLSTRPEKFMGDIEIWDGAEKDLADSLDSINLPWKKNPGDGAFYGPKIDITLQDALKRQHQCATIQLDFQLPKRFNLSFIDEKGEKQHPVMIHRAILGSVERMVAVLTENYGGKWPFWISPRQVMVVPVGIPFNNYAREVADRLRALGFCAEADTDDGNTMNKKVRNAQIAQFNFIFVVGEKEMTNSTVNVRTRDNKQHGEFSIQEVVDKFNVLREQRILKSEEHGWGPTGDQAEEKSKSGTPESE